MNGQTGKIVGDLPADNGAFWRFVAMWEQDRTCPLCTALGFLVLL